MILFEGSLGLNTEFLNPIKNLNFPPDFDPGSITHNPTTYTAAVGSALQLRPSVSLLPKKLKQRETLRWVNRIGILTSVSLLVFALFTSISTKLNIDAIRAEIIPMQTESDLLSYVEKNHSSLSKNKVSVEEQINVLSYDIEYFNRILAINKFLSYYTLKK